MDFFPPATHTYFDPMHCLCASSGVSQYHLNGFVNAYVDAGGTLPDLDVFQRLIAPPACQRNDHYCEICEMWERDDIWQDHKLGKKHRKNAKKVKRYAGTSHWNNRDGPEENGNRDGPHGSHGSVPGQVLHIVRIRAASQDTTSLVFPVCDAGRTKCGDIVLSPEVSWCEMAASWQSVTGTNLLPPEGTRTSTVAAELCDEILTAVAVADDEP